MSEPVKTRRPYRSTLRAQRAEENRRRILEEATRLFLAQGYPRTSIAAVASAAGVSADLVFHLFGTKRSLLEEVMNFAATGRTDSPPVLEQDRPRQTRDEPDQRRQIAMFAADIAGRLARVGPLDDVMRGAAVVDDAVAETRRKMQRTRLVNISAFVGWVAAHGPLRTGLSAEEGGQAVWALTSRELHRMQTVDLGWSHERYVTWLGGVIERELLPPHGLT